MIFFRNDHIQETENVSQEKECQDWSVKDSATNIEVPSEIIVEEFVVLDKKDPASNEQMKEKSSEDMNVKKEEEEEEEKEILPKIEIVEMTIEENVVKDTPISNEQMKEKSSEDMNVKKEEEEEKEILPKIEIVEFSIDEDPKQDECDASSDYYPHHIENESHDHNHDHNHIHNHNPHSHHNHNHDPLLEYSTIPDEYKHPYLAVFLTTISALAATLGGAFVVFVYPPSPKVLGFMLSFSAGIMIYVL